MAWIRLILGLLVAIGIYVAINLFLSDRQDSRFVRDLSIPKVATAESLRGQRKILIVGGSNALYGMRCAVLRERLRLPCVNLTTGVPVGLDILLVRARPFIEPGDIVLTPFEYEFFSEDEQTILTKRLGNTYLLAFDRRLMLELGWHKSLAAIFGMSFEDMVSRAIERVLVATGILIPWHNRARITPEGDIAGATKEVGFDYVASLERATAFGPAPSMLQTDPVPYGTRMIREFLHDMRRLGATTIGMLPTTFDDARLEPAYARHIRSLYEECGGLFLDLPNEARFPREMFYDMAYHLAEPAQLQHSAQVADAIAARLGAPPAALPPATDCP
jgi:hypothetical protein